MKLFLRLIVVFILAAPAFAQNEVISPNENLVVEGVPPIPGSLAGDCRPLHEFSRRQPAKLGSD
jgi:hypothetical protein